jgi:hypothetical protein
LLGIIPENLKIPPDGQLLALFQGIHPPHVDDDSALNTVCVAHFVASKYRDKLLP